MENYLIAIGAIFSLLAGGLLVERLYRLFARSHPELGPYRQEGGGCGACSQGSGCAGKASCGPEAR